MSKTGPFISQQTLRLIWIFFSLFIIYGTLIPFNLAPDGGSITTNISNISFIPFTDPDGSRSSIPDMVQNVLFFIPFGFLGFFSIRSHRPIYKIILITFLGSFLSGFVEILQLFTIDRTTSVTDLLTNSGGAFAGAFIALILFDLYSKFNNHSWFVKLREDKYFFLVLIAIIFIGVGALHPFDFTLDVGSVGSKVKHLINNPIEFSKSLSDEGVVFIRLFLYSFLVSLWLKRRNIQNFHNKAFVLSALLAIFFEMCQIFVQSRMPGIQDIIVILIACLLGTQFSRLRLRQVPKKTWAMLMVSTTGIAAAIQMLSPFQWESKSGGFNWIPFFAYYERTTFLALANFIESMLIYFPMGFVLMYLYYNHANYFRIVHFTLISIFIASFLEFMQMWIPGRYADITDILGAMVGTLAGILICLNWKRTFESSKDLNY